ncbi:MAG: hypothetical protein DWB44_16515 [Chloroflexi bacterium]|nr:hypothetical protein [Chloroflexota bacterium]
MRALVRAQMAHRLRNVIGICSTNQRDQIGINLYALQGLCHLSVNTAASEVDAAARDAVVRGSPARTRRVGRGTGQTGQILGVRRAVVDQSLEQIVMATFTSTFPVALLENCQSTLKFLR